MKTFPWIKSFIFVVFAILCWNYFSGISNVPFHPDESTQIYTSADVPQWIQNPLSLAFIPTTTVDERMRYRLIDSPVTRTLIGSGLLIRGQYPVQSDWDWSKSWLENKNSGALPSPESLLTARWSVAWMFPLSCLFLFLTAKKIGGWGTACLSVLLFSTNALILIHTRRAMAESALICLLCASIWALVCLDRRIWISAIPIGLAINSKQITFSMLGLGLLNSLVRPARQSKINYRLQLAGIFSFVVLIISAMLNPVYWKSPLSAIQAGLYYRTDLAGRMESDYRKSFSPIEQSAILIGQVFIEPPSVADFVNYRNDTREQENSYFSNPVNNLFRNFSGGAIFFGLTLFGWLMLLRKVTTREYPDKYAVYIFLVITALILLTILFFTPIHFQRYYLALVPLTIIAQAIAMSSILDEIYSRIKKELPD